MCGLAGLVCTRAGCGADHSRIVARMCELQHHRGPDDTGVVEDGAVCLGSNRLKIIDLSAAGHMPMTDPASGWHIVYNGEIYNFDELRRELLDAGHTFRSRTDTEVILKAFQVHGEACLDRFIGMFAFAIYDPKSRALTLVRDRYGKKPLYYTLHDGHLLFASEMQALMQVMSGLRPNQLRLAEWSLYRNVDFGSPETLVEGIQMLEPGKLLRIVDGVPGQPRSWYDPDAHIDRARFEEFARQPESAVLRDFEELTRTAIVDRLVSDVPVGTLCSGGIDSSLITAIAAKNIQGDFSAFNVSVQGYEGFDENRYARLVTDSLGVKLHTYPMTGADFRRTLPRAIYHSDVPLTHPNSIAFLLISEFARDRGVTVLLSGEAADELFGGYFHRYRRLGQLRTARRLMKRGPSWLRTGLTLLGYVADGVPLAAFSTYQGLLAHTTSFIDRYAREDLRIRCENAYSFIENERDRVIMASMLADIRNFLTPLLRRLDRMSMAGSIECRVPFLDQRLVHTAINLPLDYKLRGRKDKWLVKQVAAAHLPDAIINRKKQGFPLPVGDYIAPIVDPGFFRKGFCTEVLGLREAGLLQTVTSWRDNVQGFFSLLSLEIWGRMFFLNEPLPQVSEKLAAIESRTPR